MKPLRILYVSPMDMAAKNGMAQLQRQLLATLSSLYGEGAVDLLSLGAPPERARRWLQEAGLAIHVLEGCYPLLARLNATAWYGGGAILCNKLRWTDHFGFPLRTPLPRTWRERYDLIVCYYAWGHRLLRLDRAANKVIMNLGDVMADRHERIGVRRWISMDARDERAILQSQSRCVAVSSEDAAEFERLYGVRTDVLRFVPPDAEELISLADEERPPRIGYFGAPSYHNEEVMRVLAHPEFLARLGQGGIELVVAGGICDTADPQVLRALKMGGARILGRIGSSLDFYRQISTTVNPVGPSTGVKIKSIETLIAGRNLITTRYGADRSLCDSFPKQIIYTEWPVDPGALAKLAVAAARSTSRMRALAAHAYVKKATKELRELHTI